MLPETERLIRESWSAVVADPEAFAERFYDRLFELDPEARALFRSTDMAAQHRKFTDMLGQLVATLDEPRRLVADLAAAGRRHAAYGVRDADYDTVGTALLHTLGETLGDRFSPELRDAWRETYSLLAAVMRRGAARARATRVSPEPADARIPTVHPPRSP